MRAVLNTLYNTSGVLACLFLIAIGVLTLLSIVSRMLNMELYSLDEFTGWSMAASTFLGLASTLRRNEHIRVSLLIERLSPSYRRFAEFVALLVATLFMCVFAWQAIDGVMVSYAFGELTQGMVPVPLWVPQSGMAIGVTVMFIALVDDLVESILGRTVSYRRCQ